MHLTQSLLISYFLNFISTLTLFFCFRCFREYLPLTVSVSVALILSLLIKAGELYNPIAVEFFFSILKAAIIALPVSLAFESIPFAGRLIDFLRGMQFAEINFAQSRNSIFESMFDLMLPVLIFNYDLFLNLLDVYIDYMSAPLIKIESAKQLLFSIIMISSSGLKNSLQVILPVIVLCLSIELLVAFLSKVFPRMNVSTEFNIAKAFFGLVAVYYAHFPRGFLPWLQTNIFQQVIGS